MKWTWSKTLDLAYEPQTPFVRRLDDKLEPFIGEIEEALEIPLEQAHRPLKQCSEMTITITRPRSGDVITLNSETLESVSLQTEQNLTSGISGNVTKYNILSGIGRFYDDALGHTVSFKILESVSAHQKQLLTWSLHHAQATNTGKIEFEIQRVVSAKGKVKRYLVHSVKAINKAV